MKFTLALIIIAAFVGCAFGCTDESWAEFKATHEKNYASDQEELRRREIFCENVSDINQHNERYDRGEVTYKKGVNQFTDWSKDEFAAWVGNRGIRRNH